MKKSAGGPGAVPLVAQLQLPQHPLNIPSGVVQQQQPQQRQENHQHHQQQREGAAAEASLRNGYAHAVGNDNNGRNNGSAVAEANPNASVYAAVFHNAPVGMAVCCLGGNIVDSNPMFTRLSGIPKEELCQKTIFQLTDKDDLKLAFEGIHDLLNENVIEGAHAALKRPVFVRGCFVNEQQQHMRMQISMTFDEHGMRKQLCVTVRPEDQYQNNADHKNGAVWVVPDDTASGNSCPNVNWFETIG